jgi:serine/threonine protein kinase
MAPEQMTPQGRTGRPLTVAADVWSLGAILYKLLAGHPPYMENNPHVDELRRGKESGPAPVFLKSRLE